MEAEQVAFRCADGSCGVSIGEGVTPMTGVMMERSGMGMAGMTTPGMTTQGMTTPMTAPAPNAASRRGAEIILATIAIDT